MKIALVGAPNSGKTELAQQLQEKLENSKIVDDYIPALEQRSDVALGHFGTYIGNIQSALARWEAERIAAKDAENLICCGTIIETCVYAAINGLIQFNASGPIERPQMDQRSQIALMLLGVVALDTVDYDHLFYLPLSQEWKDEHGWDGAVDDEIKASAETLQIQMVELPAERDDRLSLVLDGIKDKAPTS